MKSIQVRDIYGSSFTVDLDEPRTVFRLKEKLFEQNRNAYETLIIQEKNTLIDYQFVETETALIFDEGIFQSKCFPSVSDGFPFKMCPFEHFFMNVPRFVTPDLRNEQCIDTK
jgi:hypothetical protein